MNKAFIHLLIPCVCGACCNTLKNLFNRVCVPIRSKVMTVKIFNTITGSNESKTLIKNLYMIVHVYLMVKNVV